MKIIVKFLKKFFIGIVYLYKLLISPAIPARCRFLPTCSDYAIEAIEKRGVFAGIILTAKRIARCHPFGGHGIDNVPEKK